MFVRDLHCSNFPFDYFLCRNSRAAGSFPQLLKVVDLIELRKISDISQPPVWSRSISTRFTPSFPANGGIICFWAVCQAHFRGNRRSIRFAVPRSIDPLHENSSQTGERSGSGKRREAESRFFGKIYRERIPEYSLISFSFSTFALWFPAKRVTHRICRHSSIYYIFMKEEN